MNKTPQCSSFYRLFYVLYSRSTDSYCCHMPWQVTGDSSLHTLFHTIPPLMSLWLKGINSRNPILWESVFLLIVFRFTWLKWMFDLQVNVFVMFCCNNYKSIDNPLTIHWQSIDNPLTNPLCTIVEWSGELSKTPVSTALCDAVTHDTATALLTSSHSRYVSHYIIGIFVQFFPFLQAHTRVATTKKGWKRGEGAFWSKSAKNRKDRAWSELQVTCK